MKKGFYVVCPSSSIPYMDKEQRERAVERFERNGYSINFGQHIDDCELGNRSTIEKRIDDLHNALKDKSTKYIIAGAGGFHVNELLSGLDFNLIKNSSKPIIGFSDITVLQNAVCAKTGLINYSGPNFTLFGMDQGFEYIEKYFFENIQQDNFDYISSNSWSDDEWYSNQDKREFLVNKGPLVISSGDASGVILGGNVSSLALLQGTNYMPKIENCILLAEEDCAAAENTFDIMIRQLRGIIESSGIPNAILLGRFQKDSKINDQEIKDVMRLNFGNLNIPIIANIDFGHTTPCFTFPIGALGNVKANFQTNKYSINTQKDF